MEQNERYHKVWGNPRLIVAALVPALVTLLVYLPALRNGFVNWDDHIYVLNNTHIRTFNFDLIRTSFFSFYENFWLPLTWISFAGDYALWGLDPMGYHLVNLVFHAVNTFLFAILLAKLITCESVLPVSPGRMTMSKHSLLVMILAGGTFFGLHPLRVESVAWVSERKDVLSLFFALLALLLYVAYAAAASSSKEGDGRLQRPFRDRRYWASFVLFCLSLASKPMTITLPVVMLILDWFPLGRLGDSRKKIVIIVEKIPFFMVGGAVSIITLIAQKPAMMAMEDVSIGSRFILAGKSIINYLQLMIWPRGLIPFYVHPGNQVAFFSPEYFVPFLLIIILSIFCMNAARKGDKLWLAVWLFYLVTLFPVLGITQSGSQAKADRFTYLPCLGPTLLVALGIGRLFGSTLSRHRSLIRIGTVTLLLTIAGIYAVITVSLIGVWRSTETLWSRVIAERPMEVGRSYFERGKYYAEQGNYDEALKDMTASVQIARKKGYTRIYRIFDARAEIYRQMGRYEDALSDVNQAVELNPAPSAANYRLRAVVLAKLGRQIEAVRDMEAAERAESASAVRPRGGMYESR